MSLLTALDELEKKARATIQNRETWEGFTSDALHFASANPETVLKLIETVRKMRLELEDMQDRGVTELFNELDEIWK